MSEYTELKSQITALQQRADALLQAEREAAISTINQLVATFSIARSEIRFAGGTTAGNRSPTNITRRPHPTAGQRAPVKFRDAQGRTWAGRGLQPKWLRNALAAGATLDSFRA